MAPYAYVKSRSYTIAPLVSSQKPLTVWLSETLNEQVAGAGAALEQMLGRAEFAARPGHIDRSVDRHNDLQPAQEPGF